MRPLSALIVVGGLLGSAGVHAENPFGFQFGMTSKAVADAVIQLKLGVPSWIGTTLMVQAQDDQLHSYMFNFCKQKLYEVTQSFPMNFEKMASLVDLSVKSYGSPILVSASGFVGSEGFIRPINMYWKVDASSYMRLMQFATNYSVIYQAENTCVKVPT